jgi:hypothetical protein
MGRKGVSKRKRKQTKAKSAQNSGSNVGHGSAADARPAESQPMKK